MSDLAPLTACLLLALLAGCGDGKGQPPTRPDAPHEKVEHWPGGELRSRVEVTTGPDGREVEDGVATRYYPGGGKQEEGRYREGVQTGTWTTWHEDGSIASQVNYVDGRMEGTYTSWYPDGKKKQEGRYAAGRKEGVHRQYQENGKLALEATYVDGLADGPWIEWFPNGNKRLAGRCEKGERKGIWTRYWENGRKFAEGRFQGHHPTGTWKIWDALGNPQGEVDGSTIK